MSCVLGHFGEMDFLAHQQVLVMMPKTERKFQPVGVELNIK